MAVRPTSIAIGAASIDSIISMVCELELEMWYFPISCESFEPSGCQLLKRPGRIRLHRQALLLFKQADLPSLLSSYIVQVVIHYFDKQSAEFINSAAGAITVSYVMQLLTGYFFPSISLSSFSIAFCNTYFDGIIEVFIIIFSYPSFKTELLAMSSE
uniref:Uncharacterized protein n=1 Tax=Oryza sativa subsp. japonica TaxID=39947 RepID=Q654V1_ORYSJ|nr:hypothetical protein [Oryza sativa Japonica Group]